MDTFFIPLIDGQPDSVYSANGATLNPFPPDPQLVMEVQEAIPARCVATQLRAWISPVIDPTSSVCGVTGDLPCNGTITWSLDVNTIGNSALQCTIVPGTTECFATGAQCLSTADFVFARTHALPNLPLTTVSGGISWVCSEPC